MWYIAIVIMLLISLFVGFKLTLTVDKHLSESENDNETMNSISPLDQS